MKGHYSFYSSRDIAELMLQLKKKKKLNLIGEMEKETTIIKALNQRYSTSQDFSVKSVELFFYSYTTINFIYCYKTTHVRSSLDIIKNVVRKWPNQEIYDIVDHKPFQRLWE